MVLQKIQAAIDAYLLYLKGLKYHPQVYKWESLRNFQLNWNPDAADPAAMFDHCFHNTETRRMWQTENWEPKRMMMLFWQFDPQTVRLMFDDLYQETRTPEGRIGRFLFGCDTLLADYKRANPTSIENNHDHADFRMISLYLAFRYPEQYAPYDFVVFQEAMIRFGARDIPQQNDLDRYNKVLRTLSTFLDKSPEVGQTMSKFLRPDKHYTGKTLLLAEDFCRFAGSLPLPKH